MLCLGGCPAVYLERGGDPLEWVALDPVAGRGMERWDTPPSLELGELVSFSSLRPSLFWHLLLMDANQKSDRANGHLSQGCCPLAPGTLRHWDTISSGRGAGVGWVQPVTGGRAGHGGRTGWQRSYLFFCSTAKFFLKVGLIWLSSSTREWLRKRGLAGLGLKW